MKKQYHILNGDALKEQFPKDITGEIIVARECLVDGEVKSKDIEELFQVRAKFINSFYGDCSIEEYYNGSAAEFEKIRNLPKNSIINLWFEDDLFCQVNFWFVTSLIHNFVQTPQVYLVRPKVHTQYGFGGLNKTALKKAFSDKTELNELDKIALLWEAYKEDDTKKLISTAEQLEVSFPFILSAAKAHLARIPSKNNLGKPTETLLEIMDELNTKELTPVFREFNKRESIYGFGDLQVKRLLDDILAS